VCPASLTTAEYRIAEASQQEKKFATFESATRKLDQSFVVGNVDQVALFTPRPVDARHLDIERPLEFDAGLVFFLDYHCSGHLLRGNFQRIAPR
jgi:hypothetical protein